MPKQTILLVEDDLGVRDALAQALTFKKYRVVAAGNRQQALRECAKNHIDIALLDLNLGVETGWETAEDLSDLRPCLPIIVMSGRPEQFTHASAGMAAALLEKPINLAFLFQQLVALSPGPPPTLPELDHETANSNTN